MSTASIVSVDEQGIRGRLSGLTSTSIAWQDITWIGAFHRGEGKDAFACVWVRTPKEEFPVEFDARDAGWMALLEGIAAHLADARPYKKWFPPPHHPMLAINMQNIYEKSA
ncbi:MAG TPA: hypothetical protein VHE13_16685 [Opitutus sp.]|nr:hypothetical protein [Opitutus sp.]